MSLLQIILKCIVFGKKSLFLHLEKHLIYGKRCGNYNIGRDGLNHHAV